MPYQFLDAVLRAPTSAFVHSLVGGKFGADHGRPVRHGRLGYRQNQLV